VDTIGVDTAAADCLGDIRCSLATSHHDAADTLVHLQYRFKIRKVFTKHLTSLSLPISYLLGGAGLDCGDRNTGCRSGGNSVAPVIPLPPPRFPLGLECRANKSNS
jgi:hypothetical protein